MIKRFIIKINAEFALLTWSCSPCFQVTLQGSGADYSGAASRTKTGAPCTKWDSPEIGEWFTEEQLAKLGSLEGNNMCRNPDDEAEPWCLVGDGLGDYDICDIPHCNDEVYIFAVVICCTRTGCL